MAFPFRNRAIVKVSIKLRTFINVYIRLLMCAFVLIEIDDIALDIGNQRFIFLAYLIIWEAKTLVPLKFKRRPSEFRF